MEHNPKSMATDADADEAPAKGGGTPQAAKRAAGELPRIHHIAPDVRRIMADAEHMIETRSEAGEIAMALLLALLPAIDRDAKLKAVGTLCFQKSPYAKAAKTMLEADLHPAQRILLDKALDEIGGRQ